MVERSTIDIASSHAEEAGASRSDRRSSRSRSRERDNRKRHSSRSRSPRRDRSDRRSRSPDSRSRSRERRRRKKKSGWDQAPEAGAAAPGGFGATAAAAPAVSGSIHPSRMGQLGNLPGAMPAFAAQPYNPMMQMQQQQQGMGGIPPHLAALMNPSMGLPLGFGGGGGGGGGSGPVISPIGIGGINTANLPGTRQARRLYVGGIPIPVQEMEMKLFFDAAMKSAFPDLPPGDSVVSIYLNLDKKFSFVEFRTPEEATTGLGLDGIVMRGMTLRIKRPSDYNPMIHGSAPSASKVQAAAASQGYGGPMAGAAGGTISSQVPDGPNKVFCGGIPYSLSEPEVMELLGSFGALKAFHLVKERESNTSKGYCFFEYRDPSVTDTAVMGLNNLKIGDKTLTVRRAQPKVEGPGMGAGMAFGQGAPAMGAGAAFGGMDIASIVPGLTPAQVAALMALRSQGGGAAPMGYPAAAPAAPAAPMRPATRILVLTQMVVPEILRDDTEYREIFEDIDSECRRYGEVRSVLIPRPDPSGRPVPGLGKVFVEFALPEHAIKARAEVEGRQFDGRTVAADFWDPERYARRELD